MIERMETPADFYAIPLYGSQRHITAQATAYSFENQPAPVVAARKTILEDVFGSEYGARTIDPGVYAAKTQQAAQVLETRLKDVLSKAGVDSNEGFSYEIASNGRPVISGSEKVKDAFQKAFAQDPVLMTDMAGISTSVDNVARTRVGVEYRNEWVSAVVSGGQDQVWDTFRPIFAELDRVAGKASYGSGHLSFSSDSYASQMLDRRI